MLLKNALYVVTMDSKRRVIKDGAVAIEGDTIKDVGKTEDLVKKYRYEDVIDAKDKVIMPGLMNLYTHVMFGFKASMGLNVEHEEVWWKNTMDPWLSSLNAKDIYTHALFGTMQLIRSGITNVLEQHFLNVGCDEILRAAEETGIRIIEGYGARDPPSHGGAAGYGATPEQGRKDMVALIKKWHGKEDGRFSVCPAPSSGCGATPEYLKMCREVANEYKTGLATHSPIYPEPQREFIRKNKLRPLEYLYHHGWLGPDCLLFHCNLVDDFEIGLLKRTGTKVMHDVIPNSVFGIQLAPVPTLLKEGITIGLGQSVSGGKWDMFEEMKATTLMHRANNMYQMTIETYKVLEMATIDAAKACPIDQSKKIGSIEPGKKADMILLRTKDPEMLPILDVINNIVLMCSSHQVDTSIINGKVIMENRKMKNINEEKTINDFVTTVEHIYKKIGAQPDYPVVQS